MPETVTTHSREETQQIAAEVAAHLATLQRDRAVVVTLRGDLGAGTTTFTQGLLAALGVEDNVTSPTFVLMQRYPLTGTFGDAYHLDAYRLGDAVELDALGLADALLDPRNLVIVEWPEVGGGLFVPHVDVQLGHGAHADERTVTVDYRAS